MAGVPSKLNRVLATINNKQNQHLKEVKGIDTLTKVKQKGFAPAPLLSGVFLLLTIQK